MKKIPDDGRKTRYRFKDHNSAIELQIITTQQIPGRFVEQHCTEKGCSEIIGYWSKTGKHKPEYARAKCDRHSKGAKSQ